MPKNEDKNRIKLRVGSCESCGIAIPCVLHVHHCKPSKQRKSDYDGGRIVLCANCHNILHHQVGWNNDFVETVDKMASIKTIRDFLSQYNNGSYGQFVLDL